MQQTSDPPESISIQPVSRLSILTASSLRAFPQGHFVAFDFIPILGTYSTLASMRSSPYEEMHTHSKFHLFNLCESLSYAGSHRN